MLCAHNRMLVGEKVVAVPVVDRNVALLVLLPWCSVSIHGKLAVAWH
jgi:hypothetical protein